MAPFKRFLVLRRDPVICLELCDRKLTNLAALENLEREMITFVRDEQPVTLVVDFRQVQACSKEAINVILQAYRHLRGSGGTVALCGLGPHLREAIRTLNLEGTVFDVFGSVTDAVAEHQKRLLSQ